MSKKITLSLFAITLLFAFQGCKDQISENLSASKDQDIKVVNGRLSFKSSAVFYSTIKKLNPMNPTQTKAWVENYNFSSLFKSIDAANVDSISLKRFPYSYQSVLNKDGEVIIGDTIVYFSADGNKYLIPHLNEAHLKEIKTGNVAGKLSQPYRAGMLRNVHRDKLNNGKAETANFNSSSDVTFQFDYDGWRRQYVDRLYLFNEGYHSTLYLRIRMESQHVNWHGHHYWLEDNTARHVNFEVSGTAQMEWPAHWDQIVIPIYATGEFDAYSEAQFYLCDDYFDQYSFSHDWDVTLHGYIEHWLIDDPGVAFWDDYGLIF